jgi:hypothetical protein
VPQLVRVPAVGLAPRRQLLLVPLDPGRDFLSPLPGGQVLGPELAGRSLARSPDRSEWGNALSHPLATAVA